MIGTSVCDQNHSLNIGTSVMAMAQWGSRALPDLTAAGSNPQGNQ